MKIAIVCNEAKPVPAVEGGAVETLVDLFIQNNENHKTADIDVYSIYNEKALLKSKSLKNTNFHFIKYDKKIEEIKVFSNKVLKKFKIKHSFHEYLKRVVKILKQNEYDWVIVENRPMYIKYIRSKLPKTKIALHLHNDTLSIEDYYAKFVYDKYDKILSVSEYIQKRVVDINPRSSEKVVTLLNRIDTCKFNREKYDENFIREQYKISKEEKVILYHGRIIKEKGVLELIKAFNIANKQQSNLRLVIIGDSNNKDYDRKIVEEVNKGKQNAIIMTGYINHDLLPQYINSSDIIVLPSLWNEPFGLTIVESMAMEKPIISTNVGAIPEIISEHCGILIDNNQYLVNNLAEAIIKLSVSPELIQTLSYNSKKKALSSYNSDDYLSNLVKLLK